MSGRTVVEKWVYNGRTGNVERELDELRSEHPQTLASGYHAFGAGSTGNTSLIAVPSGKLFNLKMVYVWNADPSAAAEVWLYDGAGTSVPALGIPVLTASVAKLGRDDLVGVVFQSAVNVSVNTSLVRVRVGGFLYDEE